MTDDANDIELYKRYVRVMLSSVDTMAESCRQLHKPVPHELEVKKHYYTLAKQQIDKNNLPACRAMLAEMKTFLDEG